jgi:hypothetical protein
MSFLGRLFGRPGATPASPPPANAVTVPDDLATALTAGGLPLGEAVEVALREHLDARTREAGRDPGRVPFWLTREEGERAIEDELRDRLERRRSAEADADDGPPAPAPAKPRRRRGTGARVVPVAGEVPGGADVAASAETTPGG